MRNLRVGTVTGIPIRVNVTLLVFLPVLAWVVSRPAQMERYAGIVAAISPQRLDIATLQVGYTSEVLGVAAAVGLFVSVLLHELGHSWVARRYGVTISTITLWIFGGMAHIEELPEEWNVEFYVALAGPAMSVLVGGVCYGLLSVVPAASALVFLVGWLAVVNVTLAVFNMLPAFPMDGGRVLRALLARRRPYAEATRTAAAIGKGMAILMAITALLAWAPIVLLVAMFVYVAASAESKAAVLRDLLGRVTARELMSTEVRTVTPETTLAAFLDRVATERTTAYPVMDRGTVTGVVTLGSVQTVPLEEHTDTSVAAVMEAAPPSVPPDGDAFVALRALGDSGSDRVLVVDEGRFLGQITAADFVAAIETLQGLDRHHNVEVPDGYA